MNYIHIRAFVPVHNITVEMIIPNYIYTIPFINMLSTFIIFSGINS